MLLGLIVSLLLHQDQKLPHLAGGLKLLFLVIIVLSIIDMEFLQKTIASCEMVF